MSDLIRVDFQKKEVTDKTELPTAEQIFAEQTAARLAGVQATLVQREINGQPLDQRRVMAHHEELAGRFSDHELMQAIHVATDAEIDARPEWFAAVIQEIYMRDSVLKRLEH